MQPRQRASHRILSLRRTPAMCRPRKLVVSTVPVLSLTLLSPFVEECNVSTPAFKNSAFGRKLASISPLHLPRPRGATSPL